MTNAANDSDVVIDDGAGADAPAPPKRIGRPPGSKTRRAPPAAGLGHIPEHPWMATDLESLVAEMLERLEDSGRHPSELQVRVERMDPSGRIVVGFPFELERCIRDANVSPGDACRKIVQDEYHMTANLRGPAHYQIKFVWKQTGKMFANAKLTLASPYEIHALEQAAYQREVSGMGRAPAYVPPPPPPPPARRAPVVDPIYDAPHPTGMGQAPVYGRDGDHEASQRELAYLRGAYEELLNAAREGRAPRLDAQGPQPVNEDRIVSRVVDALRGTGFGAAPAAPPPPPPPAPPVDPMAASLHGMLSELQQAALKKAHTTIREAISGVRDGGTVTEAVAVPVEEETKDDLSGVAFTQIPEAKWSNGGPVQMAINKETGDIDWVKSAFANPQVAEKALDLGNALITSLAKFAGIQGKPIDAGAAEVVNSIPKGAVPGGTDGGGWQGG